MDSNYFDHNNAPFTLNEILGFSQIGLWQIEYNAGARTMSLDRTLCAAFDIGEENASLPLDTFFAQCHHDDIESIKQKLLDCAFTQGTIFSHEFRIWNRSHNEYRTMRASFKSSKPNAYGVFLIVGSVVDLLQDSKAYKKYQSVTKEAEYRTQIMLDTTPLACNFWDENLNNIDCNQEAAKLFDLKNKQEYLDHFFELSPEYQPGGELSSELAAKYIKEAFECGRVKFEWMHQKLNGEPIPSEITLVRVKLGDKYMVAGYTRDLRELKATLREMREADERTQIMLDATPLCCNFWDENYNNIDCNQEAAKLFDLTTKQEYLYRFPELSPEYQPCGMRSSELSAAYIKEAFENGYARFEWMHQKLNGEPIPSEITLVRVKRRDSYIVAGYTRDLRALKATTAKLDAERSLLSKILESSPVCFTILVDNIVRFATPFDESFLGIKVGENFNKYYASASDSLDLRIELQRYGSVNWRPVNLRSKNGIVKNMLANAFFADYYGENALMLWFVDVTAMRIVESELRKARDIAELNAQAKSSFLANMSHEIRTPMNAILGMTSLVLRTDLTPKQLDYIQKTESAAKSLLRIINDILDFSKIEAGKLDMESVPFDLDDVIYTIKTLVTESLQEKHLSLIIDTALDLPGQLYGDPLRLNQVLLNLISNSVKFTKEGEIRLKTTIKERENGKITLLFELRDTGIGMTQEQVNLLFTPFTQADTSTTRKYGGTGLGLAICKNLVEMMNGEIWCESAKGVGTSFFFTALFEVFYSDNEEGTHAKTSCEDNDGPKLHDKNVKILLAEDNEINQMIALELLQIEGYTADIANNGQEAVDMITNKKYDIVFMDIQMPEMDGLTATKIIRKNKDFDSLPIIAMTAHAMSGDREVSIAAGMNDHITKPIDADLLYKTIRRWT